MINKQKLQKIAVTALFSTAAMGSAQAATQIDWWHAMSGQLGKTVNTITDRFNKSQNNCKLNAIYKGNYEEAMTAGIAAFRAKQAPNLIQIFEAGAATIISSPGAVYPVADLLKENGIAFDKNDYISGVRNFYADGSGKMVGLPFNSSTPILYFNEEALKKAGVEAPKTWEEFEVIAPKLLKAGYIPLSQSHTPWIFTENFFSRHNLQFADKNNGYDGSATDLMVNNPNLIKHFEKAKEWKDKGWYGFYGSGWGDNLKPFEQGKVAMWLGSSGSFGGIKEKAEFKFGTTFLPYWDSITKGKSYNTFIGGAALFPFSGKSTAENKCTAQFLKFMSSPDIQVFWHKSTGYVPITEAAYKKAKAEGYYKEEPAAETGILQLSLPSGKWTRGYRLGFYVQIREVMKREYDKVFSGDITPAQAFATIQKEANKKLSRFARTVRK